MFLRVDGFYLDEDEASVACYDVCVAEGACPVRTFDPGDRRFPASVSVAGAEAFCAFRGGRVPTLVELARASHPDVVAVGDPALVEAYVACAGVGVFSGGFDTEACAWLLARSPISDLPELPIASEPRDTGPFRTPRSLRRPVRSHLEPWLGVARLPAHALLGRPGQLRIRTCRALLARGRASGRERSRTHHRHPAAARVPRGDGELGTAVWGEVCVRLRVVASSGRRGAGD